MSKVIAAVNTMISNRDKISFVLRGGDEYFFLYADKHKWSINSYKDEYFLHYYPGPGTLEQLAEHASIESDWAGMDYVTYSTRELKSREAHESFSELYQIVKGKLYGVEEALDDIIGEDQERPF